MLDCSYDQISLDQCNISELENDTANTFIEENHPQGAAKISTVVKSIGLFKENELLAIAQFCYPRSIEDRKLYTAEILRLVSRIGLSISDGESALIRHYIDTHSPSDLLAHNDTGEDKSAVYESSGMEQSFGDSYEWIDFGKSYYTYKITSPDSDKYYYGVKTILANFASDVDCLNDPYMGSGGLNKNNKFNNWKRKYSESLQKEVLSIHDRKAEAYQMEKGLIGDLWKTDKNCLNSVGGGRAAFTKHTIGTHVYGLLNCLVHGETLHTVKGSCVKCYTNSSISDEYCDVHGIVPHRAGGCMRCNRIKNDRIMTCEIHGETLHNSGSCYKCAAAKASRLDICTIHGEAAFSGENCRKCFSQKAFLEGICEFHGKVTFQGKHCLKCVSEETVTLKTCEIHGLTTFQGDTCARCSAIRGLSMQKCQKHGETSFTGNTCNVCRSESSVSKKECPTHGLVTHVGEKCRVCVNQKSVNMKDCSIHGLAKHQGDKCSSCSSMGVAHRRYHSAKPNPEKCRLCVLAIAQATN